MMPSVTLTSVSPKKWKLLAASLLLACALAFVPTQKTTGRVLEGLSFLLTQYRADFDRNGVVNFVDFTIFSSFYEEV